MQLNSVHLFVTKCAMFVKLINYRVAVEDRDLILSLAETEVDDLAAFFLLSSGSFRLKSAQFLRNKLKKLSAISNFFRRSF